MDFSKISKSNRLFTKHNGQILIKNESGMTGNTLWKVASSTDIGNVIGVNGTTVQRNLKKIDGGWCVPVNRRKNVNYYHGFYLTMCEFYSDSERAYKYVKRCVLDGELVYPNSKVKSLTQRDRVIAADFYGMLQDRLNEGYFKRTFGEIKGQKMWVWHNKYRFDNALAVC